MARRRLREPFTCGQLARAIGVAPNVVLRWLGSPSPRTRYTRADLRENLEWFPPVDEDLRKCDVALARLVGTPSGEYLELDWLRNPGWPWNTHAVRPPRIFPKAIPHDRDAELDARDLIQLYLRSERLRLVDVTRLRSEVAVEIALRAMRSRERSVLSLRLQGKPRSTETSWWNVAQEADFDSVPLTKEIFKVAVKEFLTEYARILSLLMQDPDFFLRSAAPASNAF